MLQSIKKLIGIEAKTSLANPSPELIALFGASPPASGIAVTPETAMRCPTVYSSVKVIAESVAQLPLHLHRRLPDGGKERAIDHPLAELLNGQANDWTSAFEFRLFMQSALCLHGNAFAFINRTAGKITELIPIPSPCVTVEVDAVTLEPSYTVTSDGGGQRVYDRTEIFHLKALGTSPHVITSADGTKPHPAFRMQSAAMREARLLAAELGLTPHRRGTKGKDEGKANDGWDADLLA